MLVHRHADVVGVRIVETPAVDAPMAFGVRDKVIAVPPRFLISGALAERELALQHELAHHRGRDLLANMLAQGLLALHWFNPLACPVLGDKSIVRRLRSLTMSDISPRRVRAACWMLGAGAALALPLTATVVYAGQDAPEPTPPPTASAGL